MTGSSAPSSIADVKSVHYPQSESHGKGQSNGVVIKTYFGVIVTAPESIVAISLELQGDLGGVRTTDLADTTQVDKSNSAHITARNIGCLDPFSVL